MAIVGKKGQISIEFILLITISLVYINLYVWNSVDTASQTAADIKAIADAKVSSTKLANALNEAALSSGDMKKTINIMVPKNSLIECNTADPNDAKIEYSTMVTYLNWNPAVCPPAEEFGCCVEEIKDGEPIGWTCKSAVELLPAAATGLSGGCPAMDKPFFRALVVQKTGPIIAVDWE